MQILQGPRGSGKTTSLIKASALTGAVIATSNRSMVDHIQRTAFRLGLAIPTPMLYRDILTPSPRCDGKRDIKVLIDDLDWYLIMTTHPSVEIVGASLTPHVGKGDSSIARDAFNKNPYTLSSMQEGWGIDLSK